MAKNIIITSGNTNYIIDEISLSSDSNVISRTSNSGTASYGARYGLPERSSDKFIRSSVYNRGVGEGYGIFRGGSGAGFDLVMGDQYSDKFIYSDRMPHLSLLGKVVDGNWYAAGFGNAQDTNWGPIRPFHMEAWTPDGVAWSTNSDFYNDRLMVKDMFFWKGSYYCKREGRPEGTVSTYWMVFKDSSLRGRGDIVTYNGGFSYGNIAATDSFIMVPGDGSGDGVMRGSYDGADWFDVEAPYRHTSMLGSANSGFIGFPRDNPSTPYSFAITTNNGTSWSKYTTSKRYGSIASSPTICIATDANGSYIRFNGSTYEEIEDSRFTSNITYSNGKFCVTYIEPVSGETIALRSVNGIHWATEKTGLFDGNVRTLWYGNYQKPMLGKLEYSYDGLSWMPSNVEMQVGYEGGGLAYPTRSNMKKGTEIYVNINKGRTLESSLPIITNISNNGGTTWAPAIGAINPVDLTSGVAFDNVSRYVAANSWSNGGILWQNSSGGTIRDFVWFSRSLSLFLRSTPSSIQSSPDGSVWSNLKVITTPEGVGYRIDRLVYFERINRYCMYGFGSPSYRIAYTDDNFETIRFVNTLGPHISSEGRAYFDSGILHILKNDISPLSENVWAETSNGLDFKQTNIQDLPKGVVNFACEGVPFGDEGWKIGQIGF